MAKPAVSGNALRLGVSLLGVVIAAVATALNGVEFSDLVAGGAAAWKQLGVSLGIAVGAAVFGWARKWFQDFSFDELPAEWRASLLPEPIKPENDGSVDIAK